MDNKKIEPEKGILTNQMDINSSDFNKFKLILLNNSKHYSPEQKIDIELLSIKYQIEEYIESENDEIKLAGVFLKQYLNVLHIKETKFAKYIGLQPSDLSKFISGKSQIDYELALVLGKIFNVNPLLWIEIQAKNELCKLKKANNKKYYNFSLNDLIPNKNKVI